MLVPVTCDCGSCPDWVIIELQGDIERLDENTPPNGLFDVGTLCLQKDKEVVHLTVGYHQLEGRRVGLKKPFAILDLNKSAAEDGSEAKHYQVIGVVRHKYLFKSRPRALISKLPPRGASRQV